MILDIHSKADYNGGEFDINDLLIEYEESGKTKLKNLDECLDLFDEYGYIYTSEVAFIRRFRTLMFSKDVSKEQSEELLKKVGKYYYKRGTDCKAVLAKIKLLGVEKECDIDAIKLQTLASKCGLKVFLVHGDYSEDKLTYNRDDNFNTIFICKDYNVDYRIAQIDSLLYAVKKAKEDKCKKFIDLERYQILLTGYANNLKELYRMFEHNYNMQCPSLCYYLRDYMLENLNESLRDHSYHKIKIYFYVDQIIFCKIIDKEHKEPVIVCVKSFYKQDSYGALEYADLEDFIRNDYEAGFDLYKDGKVEFF